MTAAGHPDHHQRPTLPEDAEGFVIADLDFSMIAIAKSAADPVGHYSRPDVLRLVIDRSPHPVVVDRTDAVDDHAPPASDVVEVS